MTLGYFKIPFESVVLPYDDEATPVGLTGKKMLPIVVADSKPMDESLDIMSFLDKKKVLRIEAETTTAKFAEFNEFLGQLGDQVHSLAMPYWIHTPEFTETSRAYFKKKKEAKRGPFAELVKKQGTFTAALEPLLSRIEGKLRPFYDSTELGLYDILLASHLWGLYVVPEFQFPDGVHRYLQNIKTICQFNYHQDYWS